MLQRRDRPAHARRSARCRATLCELRPAVRAIPSRSAGRGVAKGARRPRRAAKLLDKQSQRCGNDQERQHLQKQDDDKWAEAALSEQAGHAYTDRDGHRRFAETSQNCIVTDVLKAYAARRGLKYDCV